jgi:hypothetical protein
MVIWKICGHLVQFSPFGYIVPKNLATLLIKGEHLEKNFTKPTKIGTLENLQVRPIFKNVSLKEVFECMNRVIKQKATPCEIVAMTKERNLMAKTDKNLASLCTYAAVAPPLSAPSNHLYPNKHSSPFLSQV